MNRRKLVAGNWKMHGVAADLPEIEAIAQAAAQHPQVDVALCLPATLIERAHRVAPNLPVGAEDVHWNPKGAHTGCLSVAMLRDAGASLTIVGHSERREAYHESDSDIRAKAEAALSGGLRVILCVGESDEVREAGHAVATVSRQLDESLPQLESTAIAEGLAIAYEPIWAIGTGKIPSLDDIGEMHSALRGRLTAAYPNVGASIRILYGGSVKASNAVDIFSVPDVDGALVGGASLTAADFSPIIEAASSA